MERSGANPGRISPQFNSPVRVIFTTTPKKETTIRPTITLRIKSKVFAPLEPFSETQITMIAKSSRTEQTPTFARVPSNPGKRFWVTAAVPRLN